VIQGTPFGETIDSSFFSGRFVSRLRQLGFSADTATRKFRDRLPTDGQKWLTNAKNWMRTRSASTHGLNQTGTLKPETLAR
jgi:hypothetical protein